MSDHTYTSVEAKFQKNVCDLKSCKESNQELGRTYGSLKTTQSQWLFVVIEYSYTRAGIFMWIKSRCRCDYTGKLKKHIEKLSMYIILTQDLIRGLENGAKEIEL